jgi:hypothetical protein
MTYRVDLTVQVEDALAGLPDRGRHEVMETVASALARPGAWPALGGWAGAVAFGPNAWVAFTAYRDGIEVYDVGWTG